MKKKESINKSMVGLLLAGLVDSILVLYVENHDSMTKQEWDIFSPLLKGAKQTLKLMLGNDYASIENE